jgi:hypothetical protein
MSIHTVTGSQVKVGDRIFNHYAYHPTAAWEVVWKIVHTGSYVTLYTGMKNYPTNTVVHEREGVGVQRV